MLDWKESQSHQHCNKWQQAHSVLSKQRSLDVEVRASIWICGFWKVRRREVRNQTTSDATLLGLGA
jgi:hypothetical protein